MLTGLTGINSFVFCQSGGFGTGRSVLYTGLSMLIMLSLIVTYGVIKKNLQAKRISDK